MDTADRTTPPSNTAFGWCIAAFVTVPILLFAMFQWRVYFTSAGHLYAGISGIALGSILEMALLRRITTQISLGEHPTIPSGGHLSFKHVLAITLVLPACVYTWSLIAFALLIPLSGTPTSQRTFTIAKVSECTRKCLDCIHEATLEKWDGVSMARLCLDQLQTQLGAQKQLRVRGKFLPLAIYVGSVASAHGG